MTYTSIDHNTVKCFRHYSMEWEKRKI